MVGYGNICDLFYISLSCVRVGKWPGLLYDTGKDLEGKDNVRRIIKEERLIGKTNRED